MKTEQSPKQSPMQDQPADPRPCVTLRFIGWQDGPPGTVRFALYNIVASESPALTVGSTVSLHTVAARGARPRFVEEE